MIIDNNIMLYRQYNDLFSAHGVNIVDRGRDAAAGVGRHLAGVLQELEVRTGAGQPAVESRLQRHRDQRHGE